jgi:hypothetical protein
MNEKWQNIAYVHNQSTDEYANIHVKFMFIFNLTGNDYSIILFPVARSV